jgi:nitrate reductase NapE component
MRIDENGEFFVPPDFTYKLKIILAFLQIAVSIKSRIVIAWPKLFQRFIDYFSFANFDFIGTSSVDCLVRVSFYSSFVSWMALPPAIAVLLYAFYLLPKHVSALLRRNAEDEEAEAATKRSRRRFWKILIFMMFLIYPAVSSTVLSVYNCQDIFGNWLLRDDLTVVCTTEAHRLYQYISIPLVLAYPIGIPAFLMYKVWQYRFPKDGRNSRLNEPAVLAELGFLYDGTPFCLSVFFFRF